MSPESWDPDVAVDNKSDVWAFGGVISEIFFG